MKTVLPYLLFFWVSCQSDTTPNPTNRIELKQADFTIIYEIKDLQGNIRNLTTVQEKIIYKGVKFENNRLLFEGTMTNNICLYMDSATGEAFNHEKIVSFSLKNEAVKVCEW